jgi:signal transduction histidine kinase
MTADPPSPAAQRGYSVTDCLAAASASVVIAATGLDKPVWAVALAVVAASALAWRRVYPGPSATIATTTVLTAWVLLGDHAGSESTTEWCVYVGGALLLVVSYSVAVWAGRLGAAVALVATVGAAVLAAMMLTGITWSLQLLEFVTAAVLAWTAGQWRRSQRRYLSAAHERARLAEAHRERDIAMAVASERSHIAREMHDVISHSLAVMVAQADGARFVLRSSPDDAAEALAAISETGRGAVQDMAGLLGALRDDGQDLPGRSDADDRSEVPASLPGSTSRSPQPRLDDLGALVKQFNAAGLDATLTKDGTPVPVSAGVELTVFRVVQEALTNALKHAGRGTRVAVHIAWQPAELRVDVTDTGPGRPADREHVGGGRGMVGMRERVSHLAGTVQAGHQPDGGYRVRVNLPLDPTRTRLEDLPA